MDPATRRLRAQIGAHALHSQITDPAAHTAPARKAFEQRFLDEVDPNRELHEDERNRRAEHARKAYFARLALKSAQARAARRRPRKPAA